MLSRLSSISAKFQHTAARRRLHVFAVQLGQFGRFNTQPPEGGCGLRLRLGGCLLVSTHSRPKAAAAARCICLTARVFQHTAARRRLLLVGKILSGAVVSTHSRPKAAAVPVMRWIGARIVSTHSRPKAAGRCWVWWCGVTGFQHTAARRRLG